MSHDPIDGYVSPGSEKRWPQFIKLEEEIEKWKREDAVKAKLCFGRTYYDKDSRRITIINGNKTYYCKKKEVDCIKHPWKCTYCEY